MRYQVLLWLVALLVAAPGAPALGEVVTCSDSAHVSWRADDSYTLLHGAVVTVPGCDSGETVGLQVITTEGDVPPAPLLAPAEDDEATFDLEPYELHIEPAIGVRVFLNGHPVDVDPNPPPDGEANGGTPPADGGVGGVRTEDPAPPPAAGGATGGMPDAQPAPILSNTGASVATLLALAVAALLGGSLLRRYRRRET